MSDLERQIRAYTETLDASAPDIETLSSAARSGSDRRVRSRSRTAGGTWGVSIVGAAAVLLVLGVVAAMLATRPTSEPGATPSSVVTDDGTADAPEQPDRRPNEYIALTVGGPVMSAGDQGDVGDLPFIEAGPVIEVDGRFGTLFAAGGVDDVMDAVFSARSGDGVSWEVAPEPVSLPGIEGASFLSVGSLVEAADGSLIAFLHVAVDVGGHGDHVYEWSIRRATASTLEGPWALDADPAVLPGPDGAWDSAGVSHPSVVWDGDRWMMFYVGWATMDANGSYVGLPALGLATSEDGLEWEKLGAPVLTGDASIGWEDGAVSRADVARVGDAYIALYAGRTGGSRGIATSPNGVTWTRSPANPILTPIDTPRPTIFTTSLAPVVGPDIVYVALGGSRTDNAVYQMSILGRE